MTSKEFVKRFQRALARNSLYFFYKLFSFFPYGLMRGINSVLVFIAFRLIIRQRRVAQQSLKIAFRNEKTPAEIKRIMKHCFENLGRDMIEMIYFLSHPRDVKKKVSFENQHYLDEAFKKGNGVIAVTAHFGNFPLMMLACSLAQYKSNAIIRPARDQDLEKFLFRKRSELGLNTVYAVPRRKCVAESIKALKNNEMLFIPLDQNFGSGTGVYVDFFGQKAATATGPLVFAKRTGAQIVPMFIIREGGDHHKIIIEPPFEIEEKGTDEDTIYANISRLTQLIEQYIRRYPHEWGWMHRRWKSRPYRMECLPNA